MLAILLARDSSVTDLSAIKRNEPQIQDAIIRIIAYYAGNLDLHAYQLKVTYAKVIDDDPVASDYQDSDLLVRVIVPFFNEFIEDNRETIQQDAGCALRELLDGLVGQLDVDLILSL